MPTHPPALDPSSAYAPLAAHRCFLFGCFLRRTACRTTRSRSNGFMAIAATTPETMHDTHTPGHWCSQPPSWVSCSTRCVFNAIILGCTRMALTNSFPRMSDAGRAPTVVLSRARLSSDCYLGGHVFGTWPCVRPSLARCSSLQSVLVRDHVTRSRGQLNTLVATGDGGPRPSVILWEAPTMAVVSRIRTLHEHGISHVALSPDGRMVACIGADVDHAVAVYRFDPVDTGPQQFTPVLIFSSRVNRVSPLHALLVRISCCASTHHTHLAAQSA